MSVTGKGRSWEILHSMWIEWNLFTLGFLSWIAFLYIGIRASQTKWILWALLYAVPFCLSGLLGVIFGPSVDVPNQVENIGVVLTFAVWGISAIHAFKVRKEYLVRLARAKTVQGNLKGGRLTRRPSEGREAVTDQPDKGMSPERTHSEAESMDEGGSGQDVGQQPSAPRDYVSTPESGNHVLLPYEELFRVCAKYEGGNYYVGETIGQNSLTNAHKHFPIPDTERIVALIDTSAFWNGKSGLALCEGGIYWNNGWSPPAKTYRTSLSWAEFASVTTVFKNKPADTVEFGKGSLFWVQKHTIKKEDLAKPFSEVQSLARTYVEKNQLRDVPSQGSLRSTETPPSASRRDERGTGKSPDEAHTIAPPLLLPKGSRANRPRNRVMLSRHDI